MVQDALSPASPRDASSTVGSLELKTTYLAGIPLARVTLFDTQRAIAAAVRTRPPVSLHVVTVNLDFLAIASRDAVFKSLLSRSGLAIADGMPVVWLSRLCNTPLPERVTGADITAWIVRGGIPDARVYFLGGEEGVVSAVAQEAQRNGVIVAGTSSPAPEAFTSRHQSRRLVQEINMAHSDILLVALGAPRQELWIDEWRTDLQVAVAIGVGGSFDFVAGIKTRAPRWAQLAGLEWAFRLADDPKRLWRRYLLRDAPYLARASVEMLAPLVHRATHLRTTRSVGVSSLATGGRPIGPKAP